MMGKFTIISFCHKVSLPIDRWEGFKSSVLYKNTSSIEIKSLNRNYIILKIVLNLRLMTPSARVLCFIFIIGVSRHRVVKTVAANEPVLFYMRFVYL